MLWTRRTLIGLTSLMLAQPLSVWADEQGEKWPFPLPVLADGSAVYVQSSREHNSSRPQSIQVLVLPKRIETPFVSTSVEASLERVEMVSEIISALGGNVPASPPRYRLRYKFVTPVPHDSHLAVIFEKPRTIRLSMVSSSLQYGPVVLEDVSTGDTWRVFKYLSLEGSHLVAQSLKGGKCAQETDLYEYAGYDVEADSQNDIEKFKCPGHYPLIDLDQAAF